MINHFPVKRWFPLLLFFLFDWNSSSVLVQQKLQEEVTVTAVEVPVRLLYHSQAVKNLTKEDFEIYENGILQKITAFEVHSRKIAIPQKFAQQDEKVKSQKRLFILIFNIFDYKEAVGEAIDFFFKNFFRPGDRIILITEERLLNIEQEKNLSDLIFNLRETLKKYKVISTAYTYKAYKDLRYEADRLLAALRGNMGMSPGSVAVTRFFERYLSIWLEYKKQFLSPNMELYRSVVKRVRQMEGEKWAICFQQRDMFPKLKNEGSLGREIQAIVDDPDGGIVARTIQAKLWDLERSFDISENFPTDALKNLFMEANITFHLILLKSQRDLLSQDFELHEVAQDYENCFKLISASTGGHTSFSNKVIDALEEATEAEDYYYLLVYSPKEEQPNKTREVEVKVRRKDVDVIYLKHFRAKVEPPIVITDFKAGEKTIKFALKNFKMTKIKGKVAGIADVKIILFDDASEKIFDQGKSLNLFKKEATISLDFNWLKSGSYFLIIQAVDKVSSEVDVFSRAIEF